MIQTYAQAREYISSLSERGIVPGLSSISALCNELGNPQDKILTIHIAGTNGKGSTGAFVSSILQCAGYKVGRYVSPAVTAYREIIRINDEYISEKEYISIVGKIEKAIQTIEKQGIYPTAFEAETAAAFLYFSNNNCDYALIECGMGGTLDATNVIKSPSAVLLTPIGLDHTKFLGDTITKITSNKVGIIKDNSLVFSAQQNADAIDIIKTKCRETNSELHLCEVPQITYQDLSGTRFNYREHTFFTELIGTYQPKNAALAIDLCSYLSIDWDTITKGVRDTKWQLRFEHNRDGWIFDGAHNPHAAIELAKSIKTLLKGKTAYIVGVFADKDYDEILKLTAPYADKIYTVTAPGERGLDSTILAQTAKKYCRSVSNAVTVKNAVEQCARADFENVVVFGSLSFLSDIKQEKEKIYGKMSENI